MRHGSGTSRWREIPSCTGRPDSPPTASTPRPWVGKLGVPVQVIIPTSDQLVFPSRQRDLVAHLRDPVVIELTGARHESPLTHAQEVADAILSFADG